MKCIHCGTEFSSHDPDEQFCCRGCDFVYHLIREQGFDRFYDLKGSTVAAPVRSRPFEEHDFSWLEAHQARAEEATTGGIARADFSVEGISCVGCVWLMEKLFLRHPGAVRANAHPAGGRLHLEWVPEKCDLEAALREFAGFGYVAALPTAGGGDHERRRLVGRLGLCGAFALNAMAFTLPSYLGMPDDFAFAGLFRLIAFLSATLAMLIGGGYFISRAWQALRVRALHIDLPIALGLVSAYLGSIVGWLLGEDRLLYFDFVATFVFLMLGGRLIQTAAADRNRRRLVRRQPVPQVLESADGETSTPLELLDADDDFRLRHGQALPVSALLTGEPREFSLEWINGEADPVRFETGRRIPAGAILLSRAPATLRAAETWPQSLLSRLTRDDPSERSSPLLDRILKVYLVLVIVVGVGAWIGWWLAGQPLIGLQAMVSIFVVSCPCALGVAVPLADDLSASLVQREGVFVRHASLWPRLRRVKKLIFDKTGTLTLERPLLENPDSLAQLDDPAALALARLTSGSLHPVSRSLLEGLGIRGQKLLRQADPGPSPIESPGLGVAIESPEGARWSLGRPGWTGDNTPPASDSAATELRCDGALIARFDFRESLRAGATQAVEQLRRRHLDLFILSGDHPDKVARIADDLGLAPDHAQGGLDPDAKRRRVLEIDHRDTLYLGDGANDSLAFDASFVTGTPVVDRALLESKADFYTLGAGLAFLPRLLAAADARSRGVVATFSFAVAYNLGAGAVCVAGAMHPLLAAILMPISSVISIILIASAIKGHSMTGIATSAELS